MKKIFFLYLLITTITSCKKDPVAEVPVVTQDLNKSILTDYSSLVVHTVYDELNLRTLALKTAVEQLTANLTDEQMQNCRQAWRDARSSWERSEAFLFGPVSTENIDPRIDTWPVNFIDLEGQLSGEQEFSPAYIDGLQDALKGFHPIEYLIFGLNGNKTASEMTPRELEYLSALSSNLHELTSVLPTAWKIDINGSFGHHVVNAGISGSIYTSRVEAFEEIVNAMAGICDEVANGKIGEPFLMQDPTLEESPYSGNSITDFTNNIRGVESAYLSRYAADGTGLEDLVRKHNLSLDGTIKLRIANTITALQNITVPFGEAITTQPVQVQNAINAINELEAVLANDLLNFVGTYGND